MGVTAGSGSSNAVDLYNYTSGTNIASTTSSITSYSTAAAAPSTTAAAAPSTAQGTWSTAQLSVARAFLAATSVGIVAIFAGGDLRGNCSLTLFVEGLLFGLMSVGDAVTFA
jgi:hypothetical protein